MSLFSPPDLWLTFLKLVIDFFPNVESYDWAFETYRSTGLVVDGLGLPGVRMKLILQRYLDYPEFYAGFAGRALDGLPEGDVLMVAINQENAALIQGIADALARVTVLSVFPLPIFEDMDPVVFAEARHTFELQLDYSEDLFPPDPTPEFVVYYWICGLIVSRLATAYVSHQLRLLRYTAPA